VLKPQLGAAGSKLEKLWVLKQRNRTKVELVLNRHGRRFDFSKTRGCFCKITMVDRMLTWNRSDPGRQPRIGRPGRDGEGLAGGGTPERAQSHAPVPKKNTQLGRKGRGRRGEDA
jgi:hypothetical protein